MILRYAPSVIFQPSEANFWGKYQKECDYYLRICYNTVCYVRIVESEETCPMCSERVNPEAVSSITDIRPYLDYQEEKTIIKNWKIMKV